MLQNTYYMKKVLFLLALCAPFSMISAQVYVDGVKLDASNTGYYLEVDPQYKTDGRCAFKVDYGQPNPVDAFISDDKGRKYDFKSVVDGLNFFYLEGWELAEVSVVEKNRKFMLKRRN